MLHKRWCPPPKEDWLHTAALFKFSRSKPWAVDAHGFIRLHPGPFPVVNILLYWNEITDFVLVLQDSCHVAQHVQFGLGRPIHVLLNALDERLSIGVVVVEYVPCCVDLFIGYRFAFEEYRVDTW